MTWTAYGKSTHSGSVAVGMRLKPFTTGNSASNQGHIHVFTTTGAGEPLGDVPGRGGRQLQVKGLLEVVGHLLIGQAVFVAGEGGLGLDGRAELAFRRAIGMAGLDLITTSIYS